MNDGVNKIFGWRFQIYNCSIEWTHIKTVWEVIGNAEDNEAAINKKNKL